MQSRLFFIKHIWVWRARVQSLVLSNWQQDLEKACWSFKGWFTFKIQRGLAERKNPAGGHNAVSGVWASASCSFLTTPTLLHLFCSVPLSCCVSLCANLHVCDHATYRMHTHLITPEAVLPINLFTLFTQSSPSAHKLHTLRFWEMGNGKMQSFCWTLTSNYWHRTCLRCFLSRCRCIWRHFCQVCA